MYQVNNLAIYTTLPTQFRLSFQTEIWNPDIKNRQKIDFLLVFPDLGRGRRLDSRWSLPRTVIRGGNDGGIGI